MTDNGWTVDFVGDRDHAAWAIVSPDGDRDDSYWYDSREDAERAATERAAVESAAVERGDLHTYTVHLAYLARNDDEARDLARRIHDVIADYHDSREDDSEFHDGQATDSPFDRVDVTDADDWAEHVDTACSACCGTPTNRVRFGDGSRWCAACGSTAVAEGRRRYDIEDVRI